METDAARHLALCCWTAWGLLGPQQPELVAQCCECLLCQQLHCCSCSGMSLVVPTALILPGLILIASIQCLQATHRQTSLYAQMLCLGMCCTCDDPSIVPDTAHACRPESHVAVVSHCMLLAYMLSSYGHQCSPDAQTGLRRSFDNCELRSIVLSDSAGRSRPQPLSFRGGRACLKAP